MRHTLVGSVAVEFECRLIEFHHHTYRIVHLPELSPSDPGPDQEVNYTLESSNIYVMTDRSINDESKLKTIHSYVYLFLYLICIDICMYIIPYTISSYAYNYLMTNHL